MFISFIVSLVLSSFLTTTTVDITPGFSQENSIEEIYAMIPEKNPESNSLGVKITAKSAVVVDSKTGAVLFEKNKEEVRSIASITKLMSALVFLDNNPGWEKTTVMQASDERSGGFFHVFRDEEISIKDLYNVGLVASDNNAIIALSRVSGLSEEEFVEEMNRKALVLGLSNTKFVDPTGLAPENVSTAMEIAKMLNYALSKKEIRDVLLLPEYDFIVVNNLRKVNVKNTDILLDSYLNDKSLGYKIIGGKTGYLDEAGFCLTMAVSKDSREVIGVVLGSDTIDLRFQELKGIVTWVFDNYIWKN